MAQKRLNKRQQRLERQRRIKKKRRKRLAIILIEIIILTGKPRINDIFKIFFKFPLKICQPMAKTSKNSNSLVFMSFIFSSPLANFRNP